MKNHPPIPPPDAVSIRAAARLHLGFLDLNGGLGRKFGSLGLAISGIETALTAEYAATIDSSGPAAGRAGRYAEQILAHFGINSGVRLRIHSAIPEHAGLGSGTQLSLAVATAIARLYGLGAQDPARLAAVLQRGARSGIGIGAFMKGGFVVDGGRGGQGRVPPVVSHLPFPEHWRIILILDDAAKGLNGLPEQWAFKTLPPMSEALCGLLSRLTLMQVLPAICEQDCERFGGAITRIQNITGDYFAKAQNGRYASPRLPAILETLAGAGATGMGQSSWGPTGFAVFPDEALALKALQTIRAEWQTRPAPRFMLSRACNHPARLEINPARPEARPDILTKTEIREGGAGV